MFPPSNQDGRKPKCFFTSSSLPAYINHDQLPVKKKPFSTILRQTFSHTLDVILPQEDATSLRRTLESGVGKLQYAIVYMKLDELITRDPVNQYIKTGNILMLSQGRPGIDHVFSLCDGVLRLEVGKPTYERMGLEGKPISNEGRNHVKARYAIELNLRLPSMVRGKKGFERIIWAFKNVLNHAVTWLFCDLKGPIDVAGPIGAYQPKIRDVEPDVDASEGICVPSLPDQDEQENYAEFTELLEWLSLALSNSPRVKQHDPIDPYLSRYRLPSGTKEASGLAEYSAQDLVILRWRGFIPAAFINGILLAALKASTNGWLAIRAVAFDGKAYTFLQNKHHTLTWEHQH